MSMAFDAAEYAIFTMPAVTRLLIYRRLRYRRRFADDRANAYF